MFGRSPQEGTGLCHVAPRLLSLILPLSIVLLSSSANVALAQSANQNCVIPINEDGVIRGDQVPAGCVLGVGDAPLHTSQPTEPDVDPSGVALPGSPPNFAVQFDGVDDRINLSPDQLGTPASVTVESWVRVDKAGHLDFLVSNAEDDTNDGFSLIVNTSQQVVFFAALSSGTKGAAVGTSSLPLGEWHHVAGSYDADNGLVKVFVDGIEEASVSYADGIHYAAGRDLRFGMQIKTFNQNDRFLLGALDEVRIWDYARAAAEIAADKDVEIAGDAKGLIGYWQMNEGTGTTTSDMTGTDNVGDLEQDPAWIEASWREVSAAQMVKIDIMPGRQGNRVRLNRGRIRVAILSTPEFDAVHQVSRSSLTFGRTGDEASLRVRRNGRPACRRNDVNRDRLRDLVCKFESKQTGFEAEDTEGILKGWTIDEVQITGSDAVQIKARRNRGKHRDRDEDRDDDEDNDKDRDDDEDNDKDGDEGKADDDDDDDKD